MSEDYDVQLEPTGRPGITGTGGPFYTVIEYLKQNGRELVGWRTDGYNSLSYFEGRFAFEGGQGIRSSVVINQLDEDGLTLKRNIPVTQYH